MIKRYESYKEIPDLVTTSDGDNLLIHGYIRQAQQESVQEVQHTISLRLINTAITQAQEIAGKEEVLDWLEQSLRINRPQLFKDLNA